MCFKKNLTYASDVTHTRQVNLDELSHTMARLLIITKVIHTGGLGWLHGVILFMSRQCIQSFAYSAVLKYTQCFIKRSDNVCRIFEPDAQTKEVNIDTHSISLSLGKATVAHRCRVRQNRLWTR